MDVMLDRILQCMGTTHGAGKALADYLGVSPNVVTNWKNGSNHSYRKYANQIAQFYGVTVEYLRGKSEQKENPPAVNTVEELIARECAGLSETDQQTVLDYIRFLKSKQ